MLIVTLAVAAVLAQPVSADAKGKSQNKGAARLHGGASAQDILRAPGDARAIRVIRRDRRDDARTVRGIGKHRRDRDRQVRIVDDRFDQIDRFLGLPPGTRKARSIATRFGKEGLLAARPRQGSWSAARSLQTFKPAARPQEVNQAPTQERNPAAGSTSY